MSEVKPRREPSATGPGRDLLGHLPRAAATGALRMTVYRMDQLAEPGG